MSCVLPKPVIEALTPKVMVLGNGAFGGNQSLLRA